MAVCMGTDTDKGVAGVGIDIAFGVLFSSSTKIDLGGVDIGALQLGTNFCDVSLCFLFSSSLKLVTLTFDDMDEVMGANGFRARGECDSFPCSLAVAECFFTRLPAVLNFLLPTKYF